MSVKNIIRTLISSRKPSLNIDDPFIVQKFLLGGEKHLSVFDVGAFVGDITATYAKIFPQATIYCFEPYPDSFNKLNAMAESSSIKPFQIALSDKNSQVNLQINTDLSCNSIFTRPTTGAKYYSKKSRYVSQIEVETQTLDTFCNTKGIADIDILKLDVEGSELNVLKEALGKLSDKRIKLIFVEVMFVAHYEGGCLFHEVSDFLIRYDYKLFNLYNLKRARNGQIRWGNAIFLNPQMQEIIVSACS
jgi:FkbM family methyltransferase